MLRVTNVMEKELYLIEHPNELQPIVKLIKNYIEEEKHNAYIRAMELKMGY